VLTAERETRDRRRSKIPLRKGEFTGESGGRVEIFRGIEMDIAKDEEGERRYLKGPQSGCRHRRGGGGERQAAARSQELGAASARSGGSKEEDCTRGRTGLAGEGKEYQENFQRKKEGRKEGKSRDEKIDKRWQKYL